MPSPSPSPSPWSIKGISPEARKLAKIAAQKNGMTLGQWLSEQIAAAAEAEASPGADAPPSYAIRYSGPKEADSADALDIDLLEDRIIERIEARFTGRLQDALDDQLNERLDSFAAEAAERRDELEGIENSVKSLITQLNNRISRASEQSERISLRLDEMADGLEAGAARAQKTETAMRRIAKAIETLNDQVRYTESAALEASDTAKAALAEARVATRSRAAASVDGAELDDRIEQALRRFAATPGAAETVNWRALEVPVGPMRDAPLWVEIFGAGPVGQPLGATAEDENAHAAKAEAANADAANGGSDAAASESWISGPDASETDGHAADSGADSDADIGAEADDTEPRSPWAFEADEADAIDDDAVLAQNAEALEAAALPGDIVSRPGFGPSPTDPTPTDPAAAHDDPMPAFVDPQPTRRLSGTPSLQRALSRLDAERAPTAPQAGATESAMLAASFAALKQVSAPQADTLDEAPSAQAPARPSETSRAAGSDSDSSAGHAALDAIMPVIDEQDDAQHDARDSLYNDPADAEAADDEAFARAEAATDAAAPGSPNTRALKKLLAQPEDEWLVTRSAPAAEAEADTDADADGDEPVEPGFSNDPFDAAFAASTQGAESYSVSGPFDSAAALSEDEVKDLDALDAAADEARPDMRIGFSAAPGFEVDDDLDGFLAKPATVPTVSENPYRRRVSSGDPTAPATGADADAIADIAAPSVPQGDADAPTGLDGADGSAMDAAFAAPGDAMTDDQAMTADDVTETEAEAEAADADAAAPADAEMVEVVDWETGEPIAIAPAPRQTAPARPAATESTPGPLARFTRPSLMRDAVFEPTPEITDAAEEPISATPHVDAAPEERPTKPTGARSLLSGFSGLGRKPAGPALGDDDAEGDGERASDDPLNVLELDAADILAEDAAFDARPELDGKPAGPRTTALSDADIDAFEDLYADEEPGESNTASRVGVALSVSLMAVAAAASVAYIYWQGV